jgi:hypothetical protein
MGRGLSLMFSSSICTCTNNIKLRCVRVTINSLKKQCILYIHSGCFWHCFPACVWCWHVWPVCLYHTFLHNLTNGKIFGKILLKVKCVLSFFYKFVCYIYHSKKNSAKCHIYRVIKKSLCTWWLQYRKLHVMFKVSPASLQTFIDTPNCVLEDRVQYSTVHIPNVFCDVTETV